MVSGIPISKFFAAQVATISKFLLVQKYEQVLIESYNKIAKLQLITSIEFCEHGPGGNQIAG